MLIGTTSERPGDISPSVPFDHANDSPPQTTAATTRRTDSTSNALASRDNTSIDQSAIAVGARDGRFRFERPSPDAEDIMQCPEHAMSDAWHRAGPLLDENAEALSEADFTAMGTSCSTHALTQDVDTRGAIGESATPRQLRLKLRSQPMEPIAMSALHNRYSCRELEARAM